MSFAREKKQQKENKLSHQEIQRKLLDTPPKTLSPSAKKLCEYIEQKCQYSLELEFIAFVKDSDYRIDINFFPFDSFLLHRLIILSNISLYLFLNFGIMIKL